MASFMANLFPSSRDGKQENVMPETPPVDRPSTPSRNKNNFTTPAHTPQGSPSKNRNPPGAIDLPYAFENAMKLNTPNFGSPTKSGRQQGAGTPLSPGKNNTLAMDDTYFGGGSSIMDDSIIHKSAISPGSPLRKQGKENTPPSSRFAIESLPPQNQAALSRHEIYQPREQSSPAPSVRKYNTQRGLTAEELEILQKPNVKRLANVTQLCTYLPSLRHFVTDLEKTS
jgi:cell cycle protein kinase DBF2